MQLAGSRPVGTVGTQLPAFQWVPVFREWRRGDSGLSSLPAPHWMPRAGRWGTGRSSPAPPGLATRFGLGTRIKASGVCEPDWAQQRGEAWASAPMQEPALSWDRHGSRAWGCELAAGGVAGGRGHGAGTCQSGPPETSLPRSTPARAMPLAVIALLVLGAPVGKGREPGLRWAGRRGSPQRGVPRDPWATSPLGAGGRGPESGPWEADPGVGVGLRSSGWTQEAALRFQLPAAGATVGGVYCGGPLEGPWEGAQGWGYRQPEKQPGSRLPALPVLAGTSCLGYLDENGSWHPGFSCPAFTFCCGTCHRRYCCGDLNLLLSKWQQKHCQGLRWAGRATPPSSQAVLTPALPGPPTFSWEPWAPTW